MNYSIKLNLLKFKNACVVTVKGATATKRGVFIPIEDNNIFISADDNLKAKPRILTPLLGKTSLPVNMVTRTAYDSRLPKKFANV